jgi:uncharacterized protein (TIGR03382 family)
MNLYMADKLHVNDAGHQVYADVVFGALGGVIVPAEGDVAKLFGWADWPDGVVPVEPEGPDVAGADTAGGDEALDGVDEAEGARADDGGSGCAMGPGGPGSGALLPLLLSLAAWGVRRRRCA